MQRNWLLKERNYDNSQAYAYTHIVPILSFANFDLLKKLSSIATDCRKLLTDCLLFLLLVTYVISYL